MSAIPLWIARHEAGHAVVAEYLGMRCDVVMAKQEFGKTYVSSKRADPMVCGIVAFAGYAANAKWDRKTKIFPADDFQWCSSFGFGKRSIRTLLKHARGLVDETAPAVQLVARYLKQTGKIKRRKLRQLMRQAGIEPGAGN